MRRIARQKGILVLEQQRWVVLGASFEPSASPLSSNRPSTQTCSDMAPTPRIINKDAKLPTGSPPLSYMPNDQTCMSIHTHFVPGAQTRTIPASALVDNVSEPAADSTYSGRDVSMGASSSAAMQENGRGR
ncbi:hypothetical protein PoMZ_04927 [Pyricularia oryzae]|uniref:Uncharacterized protein n=1 Tax=Pyricularia oryzae TaxID=318829 RepID=A0A4P7NBF5_PYROR|nr:hypothetical protein PoMZ_04927 [Pyricularia oryzae]